MTAERVLALASGVAARGAHVLGADEDVVALDP
jgi:hypothetical protein